jgi:uncharacterized membrane protein YkvA (DUF1232 family)
MATLEARVLDAIPAWLKSLAADAREFASVLDQGEASEAERRAAATALNYLFKSLDLIPDGLEELGYIDDALVFRVATAAVPASELGTDEGNVFRRLAADAPLIEEFLGEIQPRLSAYVDKLGSASVRGRSVSEIVGDDTVRAEFTREIRQWADGYQVPAFYRDEKNLVKLRSFLNAKLR